MPVLSAFASLKSRKPKFPSGSVCLSLSLSLSFLHELSFVFAQKKFSLFLFLFLLNTSILLPSHIPQPFCLHSRELVGLGFFFLGWVLCCLFGFCFFFNVGFFFCLFCGFLSLVLLVFLFFKPSSPQHPLRPASEFLHS